MLSVFSALRAGLRCLSSELASFCALGLWLAPLSLHAESTRFFDLQGFPSFLEGRSEEAALTDDGAITLPPATTTWVTDANATWGTAAYFDGSLIVSRIGDGQLVRLEPGGTQKPFWRVADAMVTSSVVVGERLFVATAGAGAKIYSVDRHGRASPYFAPKAGFVWAMVEGQNHALLVATGMPGQVVEISGPGAVRTLFESDQAHLRSLAFDDKGGTFVGGGERGIVFYAPAGGAFRALYDTGHPEVTCLVPIRDGVVAAGVLGAASLALADVGTEETKKARQTEVRSQIVKIGLDGSAELLGGSNDEAVFAMVSAGEDEVLVAAGATGREDPRGRLYRINYQKRRIALAYEADSRRLTHLVRPHGDVTYLIGNGPARALALSGHLARRGTYVTPPFDAGLPSRLGRMELTAQTPGKTSARVSVRTGQTASPDASWSSWSAQADGLGHATSQPMGRFFQARISLEGDGEKTPEVTRIRVAYRRQNMPPLVREVSTLAKGLVWTSLIVDENRVKVVGPFDKAEPISAAAAEAPRPPPRVRQSPDPGALTVRWAADDVNGDVLSYTLWMRHADDSKWRLVKTDLTEPFHIFRSAALPDGNYVFRVEASDKLSNIESEARIDVRESFEVVVDNTPPAFSSLKLRATEGEAHIVGMVFDRGSALASLEVALDGGGFRPVAVVDGVLDGPSEHFAHRFGGLARGHHEAVFQAKDEAGNVGTRAYPFEIRR